MSLVIAAYIATFGTIGLYSGRMIIRARQAAAELRRVESGPVSANEAQQ